MKKLERRNSSEGVVIQRGASQLPAGLRYKRVEGALSKKSRDRQKIARRLSNDSGWRVRFFVLENDALLYYERPVECDVTSTVVSAAHRAALDNVSSTVCFRLSAGVSASAPPAGALPDSFHRTYRRRAVTFFSRELDDATRRSVHHDDRALERGTVAEAQNTQRPNLLIEGSGCGEFPDHVNRDAVSCGSWRAQDYTQAPIPAPTPRPTWIPSPQPTPETMPTPVPVPAPSSLPTPLLPNATWPPTVSPTTSAPTTSAMT